MADVKNFKARLSSSRLFSKGTKDLSDGVVDDTVFNKMTSSFENNKHLTDDVQFEYSAPLIYQLDLLKEDIDDIHSHLSESKYTDNKQKFPVVDVTKEFYVTGTTSLEGNTTISGFTDIRGDFKVNGATVSNLKPSLDFANNLRTKTLVSSSAQISSDISGSFTSLSASIATDINNAGGGSTDFTSVDSVLAPDTDNTRDLGYSNREWRNLYLDGTAYIDSIAGGTLTLPLTPPSVTHTSLKSSAVNVTTVNVLILNSSNALSIQTLTPHSVGQELTIMNIGSGAVTITRASNLAVRTIYHAKGASLTINQHQAYKFVCNPNQVWYQIS